jgi:lactoylglutathione lyase
MQLAKNVIGVGLSTNILEPMLRVWQQDAGLRFDHVLPVRRGQEQYRHDAQGSVVKLKDPEHPALRANPLQSLWREQMLAQAMVMNGLYSSGRFILVAPKYNRNVQEAVRLYRHHLAPPDGAVEFDVISFDDMTASISRAGAADLARALHERYCDFSAVDGVI